MKKLFTFFVAMALMTVAFAQVKQAYPVDAPIAPNMDRNAWVGNANVDYYTTYDEGEFYFVRLNQFRTLNAGDSIQKVTFYWQATGGEDNFYNEFNIVIWTGGNGNWIVADPTMTNAVFYTTDMSNWGTQQTAYTQHVTLTDNGLQEIELTNPYVVNGLEGEVWVGIQCLGATCGGLGIEHIDLTTPWGRFINKYVSAQESHPGDNLYIPLYYYDDAHTQVVPGDLCVMCWVGNGTAAEIRNDWMCEIYSPDDIQTYPDGIDTMVIGNYDDSLYFYGGAFNEGVDAATSDVAINLWAVNDNNENVYFIQDEAMGIDAENPVTAMHGWRWNVMTLCGLDQLADESITYPFELCLSVTLLDNNVIDPNTDNNLYCITVGDAASLHIGIAENNNTLNVYPNPACNVINVDNAAGAQISIFNIAGQEVMAIEAANANETINVSNLTEGVYVVRVVNGKEVATSKVSIVR